MIVVVGDPGTREVRAIAAGVAGRGGRCEVVGPVRPDAPGDAVLRDLAAQGVGHAAVLRTTAGALDAADLELALRYLPEARVVVLVGEPGLVAAAAAAAAWSGAALAIIAAPPRPARPSALLPPSAGHATDDRTIVLSPPPSDPDGAFAGLVAELALRLDAGEALASAWPATLDVTAASPLDATGGSPLGASGPATLNTPRR